MPATYSFSLNGLPTAVEAEPKDSVLDVFRETLGIFTMKGGCAPQGLCGCCTVLIEGKPRLTCTLPVKSLEGKAVTTLDGISTELRACVATAFAEAGAAQCGYCTPGIALSTCALLTASPSPTDDELHRALAPHTCRCTGYTAILEGMREAAALARKERTQRERDLFPPGPEAEELVLGARPFVDDLVRPGMLHGAVVFAPRAMGVVERVDVEAAAALPGVAHIEVIRGVGGSVRHAGDVVAVVAGETLVAARAAAAAVVVQIAEGTAERSLVARSRRVDGDVAAGLAACLHRAEVNLLLAATDALPLEPEAALAVPGANGVLVYSAGEDASALAREVSAEIGRECEVVLVPSGGSYGSKTVAIVERLAARVAVRTGRPVRLSLDHVEGTRIRPRRPGASVVGTAGADADGRWKALKLLVTFDGGAEAHGADRVVAQALGAMGYQVENIDLEIRVEQSGNSPTAPVRGAGIVPVVVAVEALAEQLAAASRLDPLAFRRQNVEGDAGDLLARLAPVYDAHPGAKGISLARSEGEGGARVVLTVLSESEIEVQCNVPELGQGRDASLVGSLAMATGLQREAFSIGWGRASVVGPGGGGPVELAAWQAAGALLAAGGKLSGLVGRVFVGESERSAAGFAAHVALLNPEGGIAAIYAVAPVGNQDHRGASGVLEGATAMGIGIACAEEVAHTEGLPEVRFRYLGALKSKVTPLIVAQVCRVSHEIRDVGEAGVGAAAAVLVAVSRFDGTMRTSLPMKESAAARSVGVRVRPALN